jgi:putative flippase GtrA
MNTTHEARTAAIARAFASLRTEHVLAQWIRFAFTGVVVSAVYITTTTVLASSSHLPFQVALVIGWCAAISVHFTLQRTFVWTHQEEFALPFRRQVGLYLLVACSQLAITATTTAVLPSPLGVSTEVVYLGTAALLTLGNFVVFRLGVFHARASN